MWRRGGGDNNTTTFPTTNPAGTETPIDEVKTSSNTISGVVDDDPVEGAEVYIDFGNGTFSTKAITNADGSYELKLSDEDIAKINPEIPEGADGPRDNLLLMASKDGRVLRNALARDVADGQVVYITNDTEAYAQYLESIGQLDTIALTEFNDELEKGRIKDDSDKTTFIRVIREDVKVYFYGGQKPTASSIFSKALTYLGKDKVALVADDSSYVSNRNIMSGGDILLPEDVDVSSDEITLTSKGNGRYTVGDGNDNTSIAYLQIQSGNIFRLIPLNIKARVITQLAQKLITPQQGGTLGTETDSISATIPPFALNESKNIIFNKIDSEGETTDGKMILDMQPSGLTFDMPITVKIKYSDFGIVDPNAVEWKYGSIEGGYENADIVSLDTANELIYLSISHFSNLTVVKKALPLILSNPFISNNTVKYPIDSPLYQYYNKVGHLGVDIKSTSDADIRAMCDGVIVKGKNYDSRHTNLKNRTKYVGSKDLYNINFILKCNSHAEYGDKLQFGYFHTSLNSDILDDFSSSKYVTVGQIIGKPFRWDGNSDESNTHLHLSAYLKDYSSVSRSYCVNKTLFSKEDIQVTSSVEKEFHIMDENDNDENYTPISYSYGCYAKKCQNNQYRINIGLGTSQMCDSNISSIVEYFQLSDNFFKKAGFIDPDLLLTGTSITDFDKVYWNSSIVIPNTNIKYHVKYNSSDCKTGDGCWKTEQELQSALTLCAKDCDTNWFDFYGKDDGKRHCSKSESGHGYGYDQCKNFATSGTLLEQAETTNGEVKFPLTSVENQYELYFTNIDKDIRINLGEYNTDDNHLLTSDLIYISDNLTFRKVYLKSSDTDINGTSAFVINENMTITSGSNLNNSKILIVPQIINVKKRVFKDTISAANLFVNNENRIKLTPFILDKEEVNVTIDTSPGNYGNDVLNLAQGDSVYFPLKHLIGCVRHSFETFINFTLNRVCLLLPCSAWERETVV